jgi:hypothetical protein
MTERELRGFFRAIYVVAAVALAVLTALCGALWGWRAASGMAAGGAISIAVLLSWQWLAAWILAAPGGRAKRRLIVAWPLKYAAMGAVLYGLLRWNLVNVFALIAGLGLTQIVIFGWALLRARPLLADGTGGAAVRRTEAGMPETSSKDG